MINSIFKLSKRTVNSLPRLFLKEHKDQINLLSNENARLINELNTIKSNRWLRHRPTENFNLTVAFGKGRDFDDTKIVSRLICAYRNFIFYSPDKGSPWTALFDAHHVSIHNTFMNGSLHEVRKLLSDPASNNLFYGFDELTLDYIDIFRRNPNPLLEMCQDDLFRLCEAVGELPLSNPEAEAIAFKTSMTTDEVIALVSKPKEFHLQLLAKQCLRLSSHTASIKQTR